jgi:hypothetical protein
MKDIGVLTLSMFVCLPNGKGKQVTVAKRFGCTKSEAIEFKEEFLDLNMHLKEVCVEGKWQQYADYI